MSTSIVIPASGPSLFLRVVYFLFIGSWLGLFISGAAWFFNITVIGLPLGLWLINRLPAIITLRPQGAQWRIADGVIQQGQHQRPFWQRALYFLLVGWYANAFWMVAAYLLLASVVGIPLAFWMYGRVGAVTTLYRS